MNSLYTYMSLMASLSCLMFLILLFVVYYRKKNINNTENYIYRHMMNGNLLFLVVEVSLFILGIYFNEKM